MSDKGKAERIRTFNDNLRSRHVGGKVMLTTGISDLGEEKGAQILSAVANFDEFTADNDPYGEHDCAVMEIDGIRIIWKVDYYDKSFTYGSSDPSDPSMTERVMTIMLAQEY